MERRERFFRMKRKKQDTSSDTRTKCSKNKYKYYDKSTRKCMNCLRCPPNLNDRVCPGTSYNCFELRRNEGGYTPNCTLLTGMEMDCKGIGFLGDKCNQTCSDGRVNEYTCKDRNQRHGQPAWIPSKNILQCNSSKEISELTGSNNIVLPAVIGGVFSVLIVIVVIYVLKNSTRSNKGRDATASLRGTTEGTEVETEHTMSMIAETTAFSRQDTANPSRNHNDSDQSEAESSLYSFNVDESKEINQP